MFLFLINFEILFSFYIIICAGLILLYFYHHNKNRKIERYLLKHKKNLFTLLQISYFILIISVVFNTRYIISTCFEEFMKSSKKNILKYFKLQKN
jgi:hypothetical protein